MDGRSEADAIIFGVMNRIEKLHKSIAEDMHVIKAILASVKFVDTTLAETSLRIRVLERTLNPMVCRDDIVYPIDDVGKFGGAHKFFLRAVHLATVCFVK